MSETTEQKLTRLEKLAARKEEIEKQLKAERDRIKKQERKARTAENAKARKEANKLKFEYGGLVDIAGLIGTDKGAVLGALLWAAKKFKEDPASVASFKKSGDEELAKREAARKTRDGQ